MLTELLDQILAFLQRLKPEYANALQPGLSEDEIDRLSIDLPFQFSDELYQLYIWRNGMSYDLSEEYEAVLFPGYTFPPLVTAVKLYQDLVNTPGWQPEWFPIFYIDMVDFMIIIGESERRESQPIFRLFLKGDGEPTMKHQSITNMMTTILNKYKDESFSLDPTGELVTW